MTEADKQRIVSYDPKWKTASEEEKAQMISTAKFPTFKSQCSTRFRTKMENYLTLAKLYPTLAKIQADYPDWKLFQDIDFSVGTSAYDVYRHLLFMVKHFDKKKASRPGEYFQALLFFLNIATTAAPQRIDAKKFYR